MDIKKTVFLVSFTFFQEKHTKQTVERNSCTGRNLEWFLEVQSIGYCSSSCEEL